MDQCDRIRSILQENGLKQRQFAAAVGVTDSYISKLLKDPTIHISRSLAALIEEKYGYATDWVMNGTEPKRKPRSKNKELSGLHQQALAKLEKMSDEQVKAVLAFIHSLDAVERSFSANEEHS